MKRRRKGLAYPGDHIGPQTKRFAAIQDGIKGVRKALDRGACRDAAVIMKLTETAMKRGAYVGNTTTEHFIVEKQRFNRSCSTKRR